MKIFLVATLAFMAGTVAGVLGALWLGDEQTAGPLPTAEVRFVVNPYWWPETAAPRCPPGSTIVPPVTRPL
jgi:hypothetical protein